MIYFEIVPNRSLTVRSAAVFYLSIIITPLVIATLFAIAGFWPILTVASVEVVVLGTALWWTLRKTKTRELIRIDERNILIRKSQPGRDEGFGNQVQIRRLSDLSLVKTIRLPEAHGPNEPRLLADESTVLVSSAYCFLYRVIDLGGDSPSLELVRPGGQGRCAGPVVIGDYWIQSNAGLRQVVALDVRDLEEVRQVSSVNFDERQTPHWLSTDGRRIVVVNEPFSEPRMWMLRFDPESGRLELDVNFRDAGSERVGVSFDRESWPHGASGPAVPHGTVFLW